MFTEFFFVVRLGRVGRENEVCLLFLGFVLFLAGCLINFSSGDFDFCTVGRVGSLKRMVFLFFVMEKGIMDVLRY